MTRFETATADPATGEPRWRLVFESRELQLLQGLPEMLRQMLADPERNKRVIDRLFPRAHASESEEAEHRRLIGRTLFEERRELIDSIALDLSLAAVMGTTPSVTLSPGDMDRWLRFLNDVRLTLATELGLERSSSAPTAPPPAPGHPDALKHALLEYLGGLTYVMVEGLQGGNCP